MELFRCSNCHCLISYEDLLCPYCGNKVTVENKIIKEQKNTHQKTNLIIGIITLLIAVLGVTFAYFYATAISIEDAVTIKSAYVSITYDGGTKIIATNLIPVTKEVDLNNYKKTELNF